MPRTAAARRVLLRCSAPARPLSTLHGRLPAGGAPRPPGGRRHFASHPAPNSASAPLDFGDAANAYSHMGNGDLLRAVGVFTACGCAPLVRNAESLLSLATRVLGPNAVAFVVRPTFFRQFCVGEDVEGIAPVLDRLRAAGIGGILDYAAEADLEEGEGGAGAAAAADPGRITYRTHGVSTPPVYSARVYHYANERECDANAAIF
eukprot:COSAG04_NODE_8631_length_948_cov_1.215548_1_plen_204_part_01